MALECAHCGTRVPDGTTRCPQCLRTTALVEIPSDRANGSGSRARGVWIGAIALAILATAAGLLALTKMPRRRSAPGSPLARAMNADRGIPDAFASHGGTAAWVAQVRSGNGDLVHARSVLDLVSAGLTHARWVDDPYDAPPSRTVDEIAHALARDDGRVTSLDLARLAVSVLRDAGTRADLAEQTTGVRAGEAADPSALLGRYVAVVGDTAIDVAGRALVASRDLHVRTLDPDAITGAMMAQSSLHAAYSGAGRDRVVALADGAVAAWRDGVVPLAVRAEAWRIAGASGGLGLADQDLASAIALRDSDAPLHLLRARMALLAGRGDLVASEVAAARSRANAFGAAALAAAIVGTAATDGGDRCAPLRDAHEAWANDAWTLCHATDTGAPEVRDAAQRLAADAVDPMRLAYAAAFGAEGTLARVRGPQRDEYAMWLVALGRRDLASAALGLGDAGR
jgi:hypothetical protein